MRVKILVGALVALALAGLGAAWRHRDWLAGAPSYAAEAPQANGPTPPMAFGMNVGSLSYYSQEFPFADIIQQSQFLVHDADNKVVRLEASALTLDPGGHPVGVPLGTHITVMIKSGGGDRLPSGRYACRISPGWKMRATVAATVTPKADGFTLVVAPSPSSVSLRLDLVASADKADLTTLSCRPPDAAPDALFSPVFLRGLKPFGVIRFMDWMKTNNAPPRPWATRTTAASLTQASTRGVSVEYMVALANTLGADPWFTQPLTDDEAYYHNFAVYVRDHLAPGRKAYVEVSNEVWNVAFEQGKIALAQGKQTYPGVDDLDATTLYYADRTRAVMRIWTEVFAKQPRRLVRVFATQAGSVRRPTLAFQHADTRKYVDVLAIAPYFGPPTNEPPRDVPDPAGYVLARGADYVDQAIRRGLASRAVAERFGLPLVTYEGGPAYVSYRPRLAEPFKQAENDPRMYDIYMRFLTEWRHEVGGLYVAFNYVNPRWGHLLYSGQPLSDAPKMRALVEFIGRDSGADRARN